MPTGSWFRILISKAIGILVRSVPSGIKDRTRATKASNDNWRETKALSRASNWAADPARAPVSRTARPSLSVVTVGAARADERKRRGKAREKYMMAEVVGRLAGRFQEVVCEYECRYAEKWSFVLE